MAGEQGGSPRRQGAARPGHPEVQTAEGLGGVNVRGVDDPRTRTGLPDVAEPKPSDPDWVHRRDPAEIPKYTPGAGE